MQDMYANLISCPPHEINRGESLALSSLQTDSQSDNFTRVNAGVV